MLWVNIRRTYPNQWLVIEAIQAHTENNQRKIDRASVVDTCVDGSDALQCYQRLHQQYPQREFYFVHTSRETLDIIERRWTGIRRSYAAGAQR